LTVAGRTEQRKQALRSDAPRVPPIPDSAWLSLGCTPLNLGVSGRADGGIAKGMYLWYVGKSSTGKTAHALTLMAEASINQNFKGYRYYYDNVEKGNYFNIAKWFPRLAPQLRPPPAHPKNKRIREGDSSKVEEFYYHLDSAVRHGPPCIYVVDSMDGLEGQVDEAKFLQMLGAYGTDEKTPGSMGMAVAKYNSGNIKRYQSLLGDSGSILMVINQTRANVVQGPAAMYAPKERPGQGGFALKFYASCELWTRKIGTLRRKVLGKDREYGMRVNVAVEKNRVSGWEGDVTIAYARKHGIDEVGSCVDYLVDEKHWKKKGKGGVILAPDLGLRGTREQLAVAVQNRGLEGELKGIVEFVWREIDEKVVVKRKNRYA
jgi:RecA/RadA recombinase